MNICALEGGYKQPPEHIMQVFDTERPPTYYFLPFSTKALEINYLRYQNLEILAEPTAKLAGREISIRLNAPSKTYPINHLAIRDFSSGFYHKIDLPENAVIRNYKLSFDDSKLAASYEADDGVHLLTVDLNTGKTRFHEDIFLNDAFGDTGFWWTNDHQTLLIKSIPKNRKSMPMSPKVPLSPIIEETDGKVSTDRTYQNLLKNKYDELLYDYFFTSQLVYLNTNTSKQKMISKPAIWEKVDLSPDNEYILTSKIAKPYSYLVPDHRFPKTYLILDKKGKEIKDMYQRPLQDEVPIGGTYQGPRRYEWQPHKDATLVWVEALDNGDPKVIVENRDRIMQLAAPFELPARELFRLQYRFSDIEWSEIENELICSEYDRDRLWIKSWLYQLESDDPPQLILDINRQDLYNQPGKLLSQKTLRGETIFFHRNEHLYYNNNIGASPEGRRPFLAKLNPQTREKEILWLSEMGKYEFFQLFTSLDFNEIIIQSESPQEYRNLFMINLMTGERRALTHFPNPYPEITNLKTELITYKRGDGISLSGTLILPSDYQEGDRLPLIFEAYPDEFTDATTAGQIDDSQYRFPNFWGASTRYLVLDGFAVLQNASIPIIGDPETVNETFIEQTISSVQAAIDYLDERGIIDPEKVGITGHSYGAFMVANVLAHSDICAAGVAKSGAYNRTLTPFGFQSERRTLWQAKDFYIEVSPFMQADKIKEPLLLIHGEEDPNSGTYPMQSQRFYQALKGNGGTARLVILPSEGHSYSARESLLHVLAEQREWFKRFLEADK